MNEKIYYLSFIFFTFSINCEKIKIFKDANFETVLSFQNNTLFLFSNSDCNFCEQMKIAFKESFRLNQVQNTNDNVLNQNVFNLWKSRC